jgi:hypothetical protein
VSDVIREARSISLRLLLVAEACASVSASHVHACPCLVCRAADGDIDALFEVANALGR